MVAKSQTPSFSPKEGNMETTPSAAAIDNLIAWIKASTDFAKEQWPDYVAQFLRAEEIKGWMNVSALVVVMIFCVIFWVGSLYFTWNFTGKSYEIPTFIQMGTFFPILIFLGMLLGLISEVHSLITLYVAPKVYVLEHLRSFLK